MSTAESPEQGRRRGRRPGSSGTRDSDPRRREPPLRRTRLRPRSAPRIAAEAGVDQRLIAYFFGSKQELFVAAVGLPLNPAEMLPDILAGDPATIDQRLAALLVEILEQSDLHQRLTGVVRAAASEPAVARMMREFLTRELFIPLTTTLGNDNPRFRLNLFGSQIVGLILARCVVGLEPLASMPPQAVANAVAPTLRRYLLDPLD